MSTENISLIHFRINHGTSVSSHINSNKQTLSSPLPGGRETVRCWSTDNCAEVNFTSGNIIKSTKMYAEKDS